MGVIEVKNKLLLIISFFLLLNIGNTLEKNFKYYSTEKKYLPFCDTLAKAISSQKIYLVTFKKTKKEATIYGCTRSGEKKVDALVVPTANIVSMNLRVTIEGDYTNQEAEQLAQELGSTILDKLK